MNKLKLIYNPHSGNKSFKYDLDTCVKIFQQGGFEVHLFRSLAKGDIQTHILQMDECYDAIAVSGGDGTINLVINAMLERGLNIPIGIIPSGTANDFAVHLGINELTFAECCEIIVQRSITPVDVGVVNNKYFINVCGGGLFTNVSQTVDNDFKNIMGKMAYYLDGIKQLPSFCPMSLRVTNSTTVIEEDVYLFLVLNGSGAGSFDKLAKLASINDGLLDFIAIKAKKPIIELAVLFLKILRGEHLDDSNVIFFQDDNIKVEILEHPRHFLGTDIDGEEGPSMPIEVRVMPRTLNIFVRDVSRETFL